MKVHTALAATLAAHKVSTVFGLIGDGNMFLVDVLIREYGVRYVATANEAGSVLMAAGHASGSGSVGVATVTYGPGLANTVGVLISAVRERAPLVLITSESPASRPHHSQRLDVASVIEPTGAGYERVESAATASSDLARALRRAVAERRPVVFVCPVELMFADTGAAPISAPPSVPQVTEAAEDAEALDRAVGVIASARRPIILSGVGCDSPRGRRSVLRLGELLCAPLLTTLPAKGLFGAEKYDLGVCGTFASPQAVAALAASDCLIAVGTSLSHLTGGGEGRPYFEGKPIVHCDHDPTALISRSPSDVAVVADAATFADTVVEWLVEAEYVGTGFREALPSAPSTDADGSVEGRSEHGYVNLDAALMTLNRLLPSERSITTDGGRFTAHVVAHVEVPSARAWASPFRGFGAVGNAVATAIGLGCARSAAPSVAIVGDGGFMLGGLAEFNTAVRHGVNLVVVVCNDGSYGAEFRKLEARDFGVGTSLFTWPDFAPVAEALGGVGITVRDVRDLEAVAEPLARVRRPMLIDLKLDPRAIA